MLFAAFVKRYAEECGHVDLLFCTRSTPVSLLQASLCRIQYLNSTRVQVVVHHR